MIPPGDRQTVRKYGLGLQDYWLDCWEADPYGSRYVLMPDSDLKSTTQAKYRKQLEELGLFMFEIRKQKSDRKVWVLNLHGAKVDQFWYPVEQSLDRIEQAIDSIEKNPDDVEEKALETQVQQIFQNTSISSQDLFNNSSTSSQAAESPKKLRSKEKNAELDHLLANGRNQDYFRKLWGDP